MLDTDSTLPSLSLPNRISPPAQGTSGSAVLPIINTETVPEGEQWESSSFGIIPATGAMAAIFPGNVIEMLKGAQRRRILSKYKASATEQARTPSPTMSAARLRPKVKSPTPKMST